jgi:hypothetical protein
MMQEQFGFQGTVQPNFGCLPGNSLAAQFPEHDFQTVAV